jgi:hypothetical protein
MSKKASLKLMRKIEEIPSSNLHYYVVSAAWPPYPRLAREIQLVSARHPHHLAIFMREIAMSQVFMTTPSMV